MTICQLFSAEDRGGGPSSWTTIGDGDSETTFAIVTTHLAPEIGLTATHLSCVGGSLVPGRHLVGAIDRGIGRLPA